MQVVSPYYFDGFYSYTYVGNKPMCKVVRITPIWHIVLSQNFAHKIFYIYIYLYKRA